ncbi:hypothetical protein REJC140_00160 [Pseudorhizobium endolithicum]|uniref:Uncharacterized protein n=1 Tax=Pseudorhizobium endolithicum TaxID=1191678 RepID=A0ABN7JDT6_9HYPH|nr:hypothetical protein [Pseudorhizobium endolithicum]CAD7023301.1 hypothetical protein REJC140_00160 [Pseudorhizobium endolithicum]
MTCTCIETVNEKLAERNTRLTLPLVFGRKPGEPERLMIVTEQIETGRGKAKAVGMFATCCPFCGVKYEGAAA